MSVRNRGNSTRSNANRSRGLSMVKGAALMIALAILSFGFGFVVLAKLLPGNKTAPGGANGDSSGTPAAHGASDTHREAAPASSVPIPDTTPVVSKPAVTPPAGPTLDAAEAGSVQKPHSPDGNGDSSGDVTDAANTDNGSTADNALTTPTDTPTDAKPSSRRRRKRTTDGVQAPASLDGGPSSASNGDGSDASKDSAQNEPPGDTVAAAPSVSDGLYHVQINVYSTREKAEAEAQRLRDLNIKTRVSALDKDGQTLYRVQTGAYRTRIRAERARQELSGKGVDAYISRQ